MIKTWQTSLAQYQTLYVGLSGGLDSIVLLHHLVQCSELSKKLVAIHVHHGLSPNADEWAEHCRVICTEWSVPLHIKYVQIEHTYNIEEQARDARYKIFESYVDQQDALLLAHHCDDQAETVLLQLCRGSGVHGLAAMPAMRHLKKGVLIRPLLDSPRDALHHYALTHQLKWVDDESNTNTDFSRNFIRHEIMPLLQERWPNVVKNISECAKVCQSATKNLEYLADLDLKQSLAKHPAICSLNISMLPLDDLDRLRNTLYVWLKRNQVKIPGSDFLTRLIEEVIFARQDACPMLAFGHIKIKRYRQMLYLLKEAKQPIQSCAWKDFPSPIQLNEQYRLSAYPDKQGIVVQTHSIVVQVHSSIEIRTRQGGEEFLWHGQTKALKTLFQAWHIPPWERDQIPLVFVDNTLQAIVGYAYADNDFTGERFALNLEKIMENDDVPTTY